MRKTEIIAFGLLLLFYLNKILGLAPIPGFAFLNFVVFLTISIGGFKLYRQTEYKDKTKATLFAVYCGLAFAFGIIAFGAKVWNHSNTVVLIFASLNLILFPVLIFRLRKSKKESSTENIKYFKELLIRSSVILFLCISVLPLPYYIINIYLNREEPVLHNRGLAKRYYDQSIECSRQGKFDEALGYANKSLESDRIAWGLDSTKYDEVYEAFYNAYWGQIKLNLEKGEDEKVLETAKLIEAPMMVWYGDSCKEEAAVKTIVAGVYQRQNNYKVSDSLYIEALHIYKNYFKTKNMYYAVTLQLLANSYREQYYYKDAIKTYKSVIYVLENDSTNYTSENGTAEQKESAKDIVKNVIASANADIGWTYSLRQVYDTSDIYFNKAFEEKSFIKYKDYSKALTNFAYHTLNKGDFHKAKEIMENALKAVAETSGEINYDYLYVLDGLNSVNTSLANYKEAEQGCNKALDILKKITSTKNDYYASLVLQLAFVKHHQGFYDVAENLFNEALNSSSPKSLKYADILDALSSLKSDLTKYQEAFGLAQQATKIATDYFEKENNPHLTKYFRAEAYINYLIENTDQSERMYIKCFSIDTTNKMQGKISYGATLNGLGLIKTRRKKYIEADTLFDATLKIYEKQIGKNNPDYATVLYNKAYLRLSQGNLSESETLFNQSLDITTKTLDSKHDKVADNLTGLGEIRLKQKRVSEALDYFTRAYEIYKTKFKDDHKKITLTAKYIDVCKRK